MKFEDVCGLVQEELKRARAKFPLFPSDPIHAAAIVVEEAGELQQAALQYTYEGGDAGNMDKEALHTAATVNISTHMLAAHTGISGREMAVWSIALLDREMIHASGSVPTASPATACGCGKHGHKPIGLMMTETRQGKKTAS